MGTRQVHARVPLCSTPLTSRGVRVLFNLMDRVHNSKTTEQCQGHFQGSLIVWKRDHRTGKEKGRGSAHQAGTPPSTTDIDDYRHEEAGFPQGQWKSALLGQENAIRNRADDPGC